VQHATQSPFSFKEDEIKKFWKNLFDNKGKTNFLLRYGTLKANLVQSLNLTDFLSELVVKTTYCCEQCAKKGIPNPEFYIKDHIRIHLEAKEAETIAKNGREKALLQIIFQKLNFKSPIKTGKLFDEFLNFIMQLVKQESSNIDQLKQLLDNFCQTHDMKEILDDEKKAWERQLNEIETSSLEMIDIEYS